MRRVVGTQLALTRPSLKGRGTRRPPDSEPGVFTSPRTVEEPRSPLPEWRKWRAVEPEAAALCTRRPSLAEMRGESSTPIGIGAPEYPLS